MAVEDSDKEDSEEEYEEAYEEEIEEAEVDFRDKLMSAIEVIRREKKKNKKLLGMCYILCTSSSA
jgi:hypothetical protein